MQIVEAFSNVTVPDDILRNSNVPQMVEDMRSTKKRLETSEERLSQLRREKNDGNFISNIWNDRSDQIDDAKDNVNNEFRKLGVLSSNLLILNTAMAKIMNGQQKALQGQQIALDHQASDIKKQNSNIKEHQELHANTLREFSKVVDSLKETKSLTQAQAIDLIKCAQKLAESEKSMIKSHELLIDKVEERLRIISSDWTEIIANRLAQFDQVHMAIEMRVAERLAMSETNARDKFLEAETLLHKLDMKLEMMAEREAGFSRELETQRKGIRTHQIILALEGVAIFGFSIWMAIGQRALPS
ncbi:hypothetical protein [Janthinobacterium sp. LB3P118]|uniref:hypothetical protein n=1 Tax=Janthinobacterium sp. LB3P118 TaxID=3424195 RepID=UPI003F1F9979